MEEIIEIKNITSIEPGWTYKGAAIDLEDDTTEIVSAPITGQAAVKVNHGDEEFDTVEFIVFEEGLQLEREIHDTWMTLYNTYPLGAFPPGKQPTDEEIKTGKGVFKALKDRAAKKAASEKQSI